MLFFNVDHVEPALVPDCQIASSQFVTVQVVSVVAEAEAGR
jgi:hypothetical protein